MVSVHAKIIGEFLFFFLVEEQDYKFFEICLTEKMLHFKKFEEC